MAALHAATHVSFRPSLKSGFQHQHHQFHNFPFLRKALPFPLSHSRRRVRPLPMHLLATLDDRSEDEPEFSPSEAAAAAAAAASRIDDEWGEKEKSDPNPESELKGPPADLVNEVVDELYGNDKPELHPRDSDSAVERPSIADEWGEKSDNDPETELKASTADLVNELVNDEWGNGRRPAGVDYEELEDLKRCLVDTVYGTEQGFTASAEIRAEVLELVNQLEAANPTRAPSEAPQLLDGNWILLYTAFSELLPLLAVGSTPLLKVKKITQTINTRSMTIVNATTLSSPFSTFYFSASADFEIRSPSRIQVEFKEGNFLPPEISSSVDFPEEINIFGQKLNLRPVQQALNPIQANIASIARAISGLPPLKVPIPGNRSQSWLLTTYLDEDFRISRGDGGLFILVKEGSSLLDQLA